MGIYNGYLKRHNGLTWEILYPKTTIGQVENLGTQLTNMQDDIDGKSPLSHEHDSRYYTESEIQNNSISMRSLFVNANGIPTNNLGNPTVAEMALFQEQFNNKTEFYPIESLTFETFDGTTWTDITSSISDINKRKFLGGDYSSGIIIPNGVVKYRITVRNLASYVYLNALYMYWSGSGNSTMVHIWKKRDDGDWIQHTSSENTVSSWPGHMYLPFSTIPFIVSGGTTHSHLVRIEFTPTWSHATNGISLYKMQWWGSYPASKRTIYSVNEDKIVTFPNTIKVGSNNVIIEGDLRLTNSRPASDVYSWAKASSKPVYNAAEVGAAESEHYHDAAEINSGILHVDRIPNIDASKISGGVLDKSVLPSIAITSRIVNTTLANFLTIYNDTTGNMEGDVLILTTDKKTYIHNGGAAGDATDWTLIETPTDLVQSVAGKTGVVVLTKSDVGLNDVPNLDATNPTNIVQTSTHRFVSDSEKSTWNNKYGSPTDLPYADASNKGAVRVNVVGSALYIYTT